MKFKLCDVDLNSYKYLYSGFWRTSLVVSTLGGNLLISAVTAPKMVSTFYLPEKLPFGNNLKYWDSILHSWINIVLYKPGCFGTTAVRLLACVYGQSGLVHLESYLQFGWINRHLSPNLHFGKVLGKSKDITIIKTYHNKLYAMSGSSLNFTI